MRDVKRSVAWSGEIFQESKWGDKLGKRVEDDIIEDDIAS